MSRLRQHILRLNWLLRTDLQVGAAAVWCALAAPLQPLFNLQPGRSAGRFGDRPARRPEAMGLVRGFGRASCLLSLLLLLFVPHTASAGTSPGTVIPNFATLVYTIGGVPQPATDSNIVRINVRSPATIEFLKYAPQPVSGGEAVPIPPPTYYDQGGGNFVAIPPPPATINPTVPLVGTPIYYIGEVTYLRLTDLDQNIDPAAVESVIITVTCTETGDVELLRLIETGANTGVFTGYLPTTTPTTSLGADGKLVVEDKSRLQATYTDPFDLVQTVTDAALIDPYGFVFDSLTGARVDGATVTLIDTATGLPAQVFGDDGISNYPATVVTGGTASDSGGQFYQLPTGGFRFPYVFPGTYRLAVTPPAGYSAPSVVPDDRLLVVRPNAVLVTGSRGEPFPVNPGPALRIDYPIDPANSYLWLEKDVSRDIASTGDFLQYTLLLENGNTLATAPGVTISDHLPLGFRYQQGSARMAGAKTADPAISPDGRTLTFTLGNLPPASRMEVTYVVEVAAGAKKGKAVNRAQALDGNRIASNLARATVEVREEFFRDGVFLLGRVLTGSCSQADTELPGLPGVRVYLEDGSFVVTDQNGRYHFEGVEPGTHVVQVDLATLPPGFTMIPCEESSQSAGRNFSRFVDLHGGTLWQVNFYTAPLPPPTGEVTLQLFSTLKGEVATLRVVVKASAVPVDNLRLTVMLPGSSAYLEGSARQDGAPLADPLVMGGAVTLRTAQLGAGKSTEFVLQARLAGGQGDGELPAKALLTFDSPSAKNQRTPLAENRFRVSAGSNQPSEEIRLYPRFPSFVADLQATDRAMLEQLATSLQGQQIVRIDIVGHTDNQEIAPHAREVFADNQALSIGRSRSVAAFLRERLQVPAAIITERGLGDTMPVADNATEAGRSLNRRVELYLVTAPASAPPRSEVTQPASAPQSTATTGISATVPDSKPARMTPPPAAPVPEVTPLWMASLKPETAFAWPEPGWIPETALTRIVIQHPRASKVDLSVNGIAVDPFHFEASKPLPNSQFLVSNWENVGLAKGRNLIEARITMVDGQPTVRLERELWFVTVPEKLAWFEDKSTLLADGLHPPTFALRLTDRDGRPLHPGQEIEYRVSSPYVALRDDRYEDTARAAGIGRLITGVDGLAYVQLDPTTVVGEVKLALTTQGDPLEIVTWLKPAPRDWILVGFAEGTVGHNTIKDNQVSAANAGIENHEYTDGRVKFFAKGAIKGEWLLTLAYDSDKPNLDGDSLQQIIDPDTYYPLYGDKTRQGYEASSAENIYVKLERDQFYALFGDMETGLTQTTLSQYSRSMNGFKSEMQGERFAYTVFAANTKQAFKKDEIRGDGTAGRYTLSQSELVINSEEVVIETRDRFHNEQIVKEERLSRHVDYDIDYDAGTLYFKRPVPSKDENFNPVFIVVRYETLASDKNNWTYGGRAAVSLLDRKVEIGGSLIHEENGVDKGDLYGTDITVKLTPQTTVHVEAATSDVDSIDGDDSNGDAYLAEIEHLGEKFDLRAWFRQQDGEFGLGQQNDSTEGMRTYGAEGSYRFNPRWSLAGEAWHEDNLDSDAKRDVASLLGEYRAERYSLSAGVREARDKFADGEKQTSRQILLGGSWVTPDRKLTLRTTHEQSLGSSNDNSDYPTRTMIGADYQLTRNVSLFAEQEFTWGEEEDTEGTRVGLKATPWEGGEIRTAVEREGVENGERIFALFGVGQTWQVTKEWSVDLSIDRSYTIKNNPAGERVNPDAAPASGGDDDFTAVSMGVAYRALKWSWWNRLETRQGDSEDKVGISTGLVGEVREGTAISARMMAFITSSADGSKRDEEEITLGMAYRPDRSKWIILEKLDVSLYNESGNGADNDGMRIVNHLHASFRANRQWQTSFYYGLKYVRENFDGDTFDGYTDMFAVETRYNINERWDVGLHGAVLHSWESNQFDYSLGADVGYLVMTNAWVSAGYNVVGFEDEDFDAASYTAEGPYVKFRMKFDQQSVKEAAEWLNK